MLRIPHCADIVLTNYRGTHVVNRDFAPRNIRIAFREKITDGRETATHAAITRRNERTPNTTTTGVDHRSGTLLQQH